MLEGRPSATALSVAAHRAVHQILDVPKVFDDPFAVRILGEEGDAVLKARLDESARFARLRALIVVRSRIAEEALHEAVQRGVRQYVLLGAGLDTIAYRNPEAGSGVRIFEVDHPATQAWKRTRLAAAGFDLPSLLSFVPVDFERQTLRGELEGAGFRFDQPALFAWLGVVPYLERATILATLGLIASAPPKAAEVVFDYAEPFSRSSPAMRAALEAMAQRVAAAGEPWRTFFDPDELGDELHRLGFRRIDDLNADALNGRYFPDRQDGLGVPPLAHVVRARN